MGKIWIGETVACTFDLKSDGTYSAAGGKCLAFDESGITIRLTGGMEVVFIGLSRIYTLTMTQS